MAAICELDSARPSDETARLAGLRQASHLLVAIVMLLMAFGLAGVFSAGANLATRPAGTFTQQPLEAQAIHALVALLVIFGVARIDPDWVRRHSLVALALTTVLLVLVLIPGIGTRVGGARRWIRFTAGIGFQPSEVAKILLVVYLAAYLAHKKSGICRFKTGLLPALVAIGSVALLILLEPDVGTTALTLGVSVTLLVIGGARIAWIAGLGVVGLIPAVLYVRSTLEYVAERFESFLHPPVGSQVWHSMHAIASGGLFGVGLGAGQHKLQYFAESRNDFVFAVIGEEVGFLGATVLLALYAALALCSLRIVLGMKDRYAIFLTTGISLFLIFGAVINIAVATASAPAKGIPLPFVSSGGSAMIVGALGIGLILGLIRREVRVGGRSATVGDSSHRLG